MLLFALNLVTLLMQIQWPRRSYKNHLVVICFKFSNFAYANTVALRYLIVNQSVVICFKFSNFAYANTVLLRFQIDGHQLLFALNLVTLLMQIQCFLFSSLSSSSCYLL